MNFSQYLLILRARLNIILLIAGVTVFVAMAVSLIMPKIYKATTSMVLNYKGTDPVTGFVLPSQLVPGYMATQLDIVKSPSVALKVVDDLKLTENELAERDFNKATNGKGTIREWLATQLLSKLEVIPSRESSVLNISFSNPDPQTAATIANAFAAAYQQISIQLKVDPSKKAAVYFNDQIRQLRSNLDTAQKKVSEYKQQNAIVSTDNHFDVETDRLNDLSRQLVAVQGQLMEASSRRKQTLGSGANDSPDIIANPLIQNLKAQLAQAQLKLTGIRERMTENHPYYIAAKAEVDKLRGELNAQIRNASNGVGSNARIFEQRETELQEAVSAQKSKVMDQNRKRDELKLLTNEMESAQRSYETATQRFTQNNLEGQSNQTDIAVLNVATPPMLPASPKVKLNTLLALLLGTILGLGFAMLAEMRDRRVRSVTDLVNGLQAPVLGVLVWGEPKRKRLGSSALLLRNSPLAS